MTIVEIIDQELDVLHEMWMTFFFAFKTGKDRVHMTEN